MSYVGAPFTHDLFITYSHGDALGDGNSLLKRWSVAFARELQSELQFYRDIGANLSLFLDQKHRPGEGIDPLQPLTESLQKEIGASAMVAVLMSPHYLASAWCGDERTWWVESQKTLPIPTQGRIAVARILPLDEGAVWPEPLVDNRGHQLKGFLFYDQLATPAMARPFAWPEPAQGAGGDFRKPLVELAASVFEALKSIKKRLDEERRAAAEIAKLAGQDQVVYLHGRADQRTAWEETNDLLSNAGFTVLPTDPDPVVIDPEQAREVRNRRVETLADCDALLLLGSADGRAVDADLVAIGRQERQLARARSSRFLPCALLDTVGEPIASDRRRLAARKMQVDWLDRRTEEWVPSVRSWLTQKSKELEGAQ